MAEESRETRLRQKIKFNNLLRILIVIPTFLTCLGLWISGGISSLISVSLIFIGYILMQYAVNWGWLFSNQPSRVDWGGSLLDLVAMSMAIPVTGGINSPLIFIYFVPIIIHVFHRDLKILLVYGFSGVALYAAIFSQLIHPLTFSQMVNLWTRLLFMSMTLIISCIAIKLLQHQDAVDKLSLVRLININALMEKLNHVNSMDDIRDVGTALIGLINQGMGGSIHSWSRFLIIRKDPTLMQALSEPDDVKSDLVQEILTCTCPVVKNRTTFLLNDVSKGNECPHEKFSFKSHLCLPICGADNMVYGVLFIGSPILQAFQIGEIRFAEAVAKSMGLVLERVHQTEELRESLEMNGWVMAANIASLRSSRETIQAVLEGTRSLLNADGAELVLCGPDRNKPDSTGKEGSQLRPNRAWATPLLSIGGELLGHLRVSRSAGKEIFSPQELSMAATFATRVAVAIENSLRYESQKKELELMVERLEGKKAA